MMTELSNSDAVNIMYILVVIKDQECVLRL